MMGIRFFGLFFSLTSVKRSDIQHYRTVFYFNAYRQSNVESLNRIGQPGRHLIFCFPGPLNLDYLTDAAECGPKRLTATTGITRSALPNRRVIVPSPKTYGKTTMTRPITELEKQYAQELLRCARHRYQILPIEVVVVCCLHESMTKMKNRSEIASI